MIIGPSSVEAGRPNVDLPTNPKIIFRQEFKPAMQRIEEANQFGRLLRIYEATLNTASFDPSLLAETDIVQSSRFIVGVKGVREALKEREGLEPTDQVIATHTQKVADYFAKLFPGTVALFSSYLNGDKVKEQKLRLLIGKSLAHWINLTKPHASVGMGARSSLQAQYLSEMEVFLLRNAPYFQDLSKAVPLEGSILKGVEEARLLATADEQILEERADVMAFATRDWIATTAFEARTRGRKIFDTPHYLRLMRELLFTENKQNGVGGVILYGPPGTGKTELLVEKNRRMGFKTRVINIHHYTNFEDLLAGKAIALGLEKGAGVAQQIKAVLDVFEGEGAEEFRRDISALFGQLQKEGKAGADETVTNFLSSFVSENARELLEKGELTAKDWKVIKNDFLATQKGRLLRTTLPGSYQEIVEDIVKGEILLAIKNGQRVVLDELDKAGPNALGGLLSFLAKSPGSDYFEYGQFREQIPYWFRVDATSNSENLNEFLTNRFSQKRADTPPIKDQLMIAAVRMADEQGNILLSEYEQRQMVGFYLQMVPEINTILKQNQLAPLSIRDIQQLTSYLIDYPLMRRTNVAVSEAIDRFLSERTLGAEGISGPINKLLERFSQTLQDKPYDFRTPVLPNGETDGRSDRAVADEAIRRIKESPMICAINGLNDEIDPLERPIVREVKLSDRQIERVQQAIIREKERKPPKGDMMKLPIGLSVQILPDPSGKPVLSLWGATENDTETHVIAEDLLPADGRLVKVSNDGQVVVLQDSGDINIIKVFKKAQPSLESHSFNTPNEVQTDARGQNVCILDKTDHNLYIMRNGETINAASKVSRFEISTDGKVIMVAYDSGDTSILSSDKLTPLAFLPGRSWTFVGNKLLVQEVDGNIGKEGYVVA